MTINAVRQSTLAVLILVAISQIAAAQHSLWESVASEGDTVSGGGLRTIGNYFATIRQNPDSSYVIVGGRGKILRSDDRGKHWRQQSSNTSENLYGVYFVDGVHGIAVGEGGVIVATTDGGSRWETRNSGVTVHLRGVYMTSVGTAFAAGEQGTIIRSLNGGVSWSNQQSTTRRNLNDIGFFDDQHGFAVGDTGTILVTSDGGASWTVHDNPITSDLWRIRLWGSKYGVIAGDDGLVLYTRDGGAAWTQLPIGTDEPIRGISIADSNTMAAVGSRNIYRTDDGGAVWTSADPNAGIIYGPIGPVSDIYSDPGADGIAIGAEGTLLHTHDSARTWSVDGYIPLLNGLTRRRLSAIQFTEFGDGFILGHLAIFKSTDRGGTWAYIPVDFDLEHIHFVSRDSGIGVTQGTLYRTFDGGKTWQSDHTTSAKPWVLDFQDRYRGYAAGDSVLSRTTDGGITWQSTTYESVDFFKQIHFFDDNTAVAVIAQLRSPKVVGRILRTENAGVTWDTVAATDAVQWTGMAFLNGAVGIVVGQKGSIMRTTDAGRTWQPVISGITTLLSGASFVNDSIGYVYGQGSVLFMTSDKGLTWTPDSLGTPYTNIPFMGINDVQALAKDTIFLVGTSTVLRKIGSQTSTIGVRSEPGVNLSQIQLHAFPNPVHDRLRIAIPHIAEAASLRWHCYDALGNEAAGVHIAEIAASGNGAQYTLDVENLPGGWYLLVARTSSGTVGGCTIVKQ